MTKQAVAASLTIGWPGPAGLGDFWTNLFDLEENVASRGPGIHILAIWNSGHVEQHWADVLDSSLELEPNCVSGLYILDIGRWPTFLFVAAHLCTVDIGNRSVRVFVCGATDKFPFVSDGSVSDKMGENVCTDAGFC